jgi:hypothetical protein
MKNQKIKFKLSFAQKAATALLMIFVTATAAPAGAQYHGAVYTGPERSLICRGDRDYQTFMSAIISYDGFVEYWKDILVRYNFNYCLYQDIESLYNRLSKVRKQIREAFYSCADESTVNRLKNTYYELETMLYFLRKYISVDNGTFIVRKDADVINDFHGLYVFNSGIFTSAKIMELYAEFKKRYEPRIPIYQNCKDADWQMVIDKWNEFKESAGGITPALKQAKESAEKRWARLSESAKGIGDNFIGGLVDFKINGLPAKEGWGQIAAEFEKNMPGGVTFETYTATVAARTREYDYAKLEAEYDAQYLVLYRESSDEITRQIDARLKLLDNIIVNSFPYQNQTIHCVKDIKDQQC